MMPAWFRRLPFPTPLKHLAGSTWLMAGRLLAMGSIAGFGLAVFVGALSAIDSALDSRDIWYAQGHLADLELRVAADDVENFPALRNVPGVADLRLRMVYPGALERVESGQGGARREVGVRVLAIATARDSDSTINTQQLVSGKPLDAQDPEGVVIERSLARYHDVGVGDRLNVKLGKERIDLHVRGIVSDAEFLLAPANPSLFVPSKGSLGVIYLQPAVLSKRFGFMPANSALFRLKTDADPHSVRTDIIELAQTRLNVDHTLARDEQFSHQFLEKDLGMFRIVVPVIVMVSALSAVFVTSFLFLQWVAGERKTMAVFLALGHPPSRLAASFAAMFLYLAGGVVLGGLAFSMMVGQGFLQNFSEAIGLPMPVLALSPAYIGWGMAGVLAVFALAGGIALSRVFGLTPRDAMRDDVARTRRPDRLGSLLGRLLPTSWLRIAVRSLFRHRVVSLVSIVAVALGFGINAAFFIAFSSFVGTSVKRVEANQWDAAVDFVAPVWKEDVERLVSDNGIEDYAEYTKGVAQVIGTMAQGGRRTNLYVAGFDPDKPWHVVAMTAGQPLSAKQENGILLEQSTARELGVGVNDTLTVEVQGQRAVVRIRGLFSGAMPGEAHFTLAMHRRLADLDERATGLFVRGHGDLDTLDNSLRQHPDVQQMLTRDQVSREILSASGQVTEIIRLGAMISLAIAALFVFACVGYTVLQRRREYQMLRLLGYSDSVVVAIIVVEIALLGAAAMLLAAPIGAVAAEYLNQKLSQAWFQIDTIISASDYLKTFLPGFILLPLVALPVARTVLRVPLEQDLRTREIS